MLSLASFDPYTLAIVIDYGLLEDALPRDLVPLAYDAGVKTSAAAIERIRTIPDAALRRRAITIAAAIWHEKRHFFDYALTGYGAHLVRGAMTRAMYADLIVGIFAREQRELVVPIDVYASAATRAVLGIGAPPASLEALFAHFAKARRAAAAQTIQHQSAHGMLTLSGLTMLEALGFYAEVHAVLTAFGLDEYRAYYEDLTATNALNLRYRWADAVGTPGRTNVAGRDIDYLDVTRVVASLIGALASTADVAYAFVAIDTALKRRAGDSTSDPAAAWAAVDDIVRENTGTSASAMMRHDFEREAQAFAELPDRARGVLGDLPERFHALRGRLLDMLEQRPAHVLGMHDWTANVLPLLQPHYLLVYPSGVDAERVPGGFAPIWEASFPLEDRPMSWCWALGCDPLTPEYPAAPDARPLTIGAFAGWVELVDRAAPLAKFLANGRRQDVVFGPELDRSEALVRSFTSLRVDPAFARPMPFGDMDRRIYFHLHRTSTLPCSRCNGPAGVDDAVLLSAADVRDLAPLRADAPLEIYAQRFRDWRPQLLCTTCDADVRGEPNTPRPEPTISGMSRPSLR